MSKFLAGVYLTLKSMLSTFLNLSSSWFIDTPFPLLILYTLFFEESIMALWIALTPSIM
jgi:hypothetical protein